MNTPILFQPYDWYYNYMSPNNPFGPCGGAVRERIEQGFRDRRASLERKMPPPPLIAKNEAVPVTALLMWSQRLRQAKSMIAHDVAPGEFVKLTMARDAPLTSAGTSFDHPGVIESAHAGHEFALLTGGTGRFESDGTHPDVDAGRIDSRRFAVALTCLPSPLRDMYLEHGSLYVEREAEAVIRQAVASAPCLRKEQLLELVELTLRSVDSWFMRDGRVCKPVIRMAGHRPPEGWPAMDWSLYEEVLTSHGTLLLTPPTSTASVKPWFEFKDRPMPVDADRRCAPMRRHSIAVAPHLREARVRLRESDMQDARQRLKDEQRTRVDRRKFLRVPASEHDNWVVHAQHASLCWK